MGECRGRDALELAREVGERGARARFAHSRITHLEAQGPYLTREHNSGNAVYNTACSSLATLKNSCSQLDRQSVFLPTEDLLRPATRVQKKKKNLSGGVGECRGRDALELAREVGERGARARVGRKTRGHHPVERAVSCRGGRASRGRPATRQAVYARPFMRTRPSMRCVRPSSLPLLPSRGTWGARPARTRDTRSSPGRARRLLQRASQAFYSPGRLCAWGFLCDTAGRVGRKTRGHHPVENAVACGGARVSGLDVETRQPNASHRQPHAHEWPDVSGLLRGRPSTRQAIYARAAVYALLQAF